MKRLLSIILMLIMLFSMFNFTAFAATEENEEQKTSNGESQEVDEDFWYALIDNINFRTQFVKDATELSGYLIDIKTSGDYVSALYRGIATRANQAKTIVGSSWGNVQDYYDCIMAVEADTTLSSWKNAYSNNYSSSWKDALFRLGLVVYPSKVSFNYYWDSDDFIEEITEEEIETIFSKAYTFKEKFNNLVADDDAAYKKLAVMVSTYTDPFFEEGIDAFTNYYFTCSAAADYLLYPEGPLSEVADGWDYVVEQMIMAYDKCSIAVDKISVGGSKEAAPRGTYTGYAGDTVFAKLTFVATGKTVTFESLTKESKGTYTVDGNKVLISYNNGKSDTLTYNAENDTLEMPGLIFRKD